MSKGMVKVGAGLPGLLKDGYQHFSGVEEAIMRNIEACVELSKKTRTSLGPNGMNKLVINHLEKVFVTSDAAVMCSELEVVHPAATIIVMAVKMQENEVGDGTNLVVTFAGELMRQAGNLIRTGLHISEIIKGYEAAYEKAKGIMESLVVRNITDPRDQNILQEALSPVIASKQLGMEGVIAPLVAEACLSVVGSGDKPTLNVDNVRVAKMIGGSLSDSSVVPGCVVLRNVVGSIDRVENARIAIFAQAVEASATEAKGTLLIKSAQELLNYSKGEETVMENHIRSLAEGGINVIISGGKISEMALHFIEKYNIMAIKIMSKFELRRLCRITGGAAQVKLQLPPPEEVGHCDLVSVEEFGSRHCIVLQQEGDNAISTIVLRGSTMSLLDDWERAIDDAVNTAKSLCSDGRLLPGAGATEVELSHQLRSYAASCAGLEQYAIQKYATALEVVPKTIAENSGQVATETLAALFAAHAQGGSNTGVDVLSSEASLVDAAERNIVDSYKTKSMAFELAMEAVLTILRVDQIIMAKRAGGPKAGGRGGHWDDD